MPHLPALQFAVLLFADLVPDGARTPDLAPTQSCRALGFCSAPVGYCKQHGKAWAKLAEPYPRGVSRLLAKAMHEDRLNIAGCCRAACMRVGEASNPGPVDTGQGGKPGARVGEVLRCAREDLLLPSDLAEEGDFPVFLRLRQFKTKHRNSASVQHLHLVDVTTYWKLLKLVFLNLDKDELLFDTSPYQFRKRWNLLLATLSIPEDATLTPGGLRGGYAVTAYRHGVSIQNIMLTDCVFERPCWP